MIPPVPYAIRMPLALVLLRTALVVRITAGVVGDVLLWLSEWMVPELVEPRR